MSEYAGYSGMHGAEDSVPFFELIFRAADTSGKSVRGILLGNSR
jgi:hypothetical protein